MPCAFMLDRIMARLASWRSWMAVGVLALAFSGCQYDPDANLYVTTWPADRTVVGKYVLEEQRVDFGSKVSGAVYVTLRPDHRYEVENFPVWELACIAHYKLSKYWSGGGTWKVDVTGGMGNGWGKVQDIYGIQFDPPLQGTGSPGIGPHCDVTHEKSPHGLIIGYGDPDGGNSIRFEAVK